MEQIKHGQERGDRTCHQLKATTYWKLWEEFTNSLTVVEAKHAMALLEFPKGCEYWNDERMKSLLNRTSYHDHEFDGCMYGFKTIQVW